MVCVMKYYSATRKDEKLPFVTTWMDFQSIKLSEISQTQKDKNNMWDIKQQATNEQTKQTQSHRHQKGGYQRGRRVTGGERG